jgi:hypothetical protein
MIFITVIAFLAFAFLLLSQRERGSVSSTANQTDARLAAESALQRATAELLAPIIGTTNPVNYDLLVSTNYINPAGFTANLADPLNVNYDSLAGGGPLNLADQLQNIANLKLNPRPPVFVVTNAQTGASDFRFYFDLNRNGRFDTNGFLPVLDTNGNVVQINGVDQTGFFTGDPEWIGLLERPELPHSATNKFIARYAYIAIPASKTLDINYIHNQAKQLGNNNDGFLRNQGVGSWEINLAAFLVDLNTNQWLPPQGTPYNYTTTSFSSSGSAFEDALSLLRYRYSTNNPPNSIFGDYANLSALPPAATNDNVDLYANGPLMTGITLAGNNNDSGTGFSGADSPAHFFSHQDLLTASTGNFPSRLQAASTNVSSYDRYTFYRLLSQLGTDSAPETGKLNLNYQNIDANGNFVPGMETQLIPWTNSWLFFTKAATLMFQQLNLRNPNNTNELITITNIPVYPTNLYTPAVHRILQLAANIYDATTNGLYPTIFRPSFGTVGTNIFINGYDLVNSTVDTATPYLGDPYGSTVLAYPVSLNDAAGRAFIASNPHYNVYGFPWVIGAKKGFPNFNAVAMQTVSQQTRKLRITRPSTGAPYSQYQISQMQLMDVSNVVGVAVWNSYGADYPRQVYVQADGVLSMTLTNDQGMQPITQTIAITNPTGGLTIGAGLWPGWGGVPQNPNVQSFQIPLFTNFVFLPTSVYQQSPPGLFAVPTNGNVNWLINAAGVFAQPRWGLLVTNQIRCLIIDGGVGGRVVDYVQMNGLNAYRNLTQEIQTPDFQTGVSGLWSTNLVTAYGATMPQGIDNQLEISLGNVDAGANWNDYGLGQSSGATKANDIAAFKAFMKLGGVNTNLVTQVPFTPTAKQYQPLVWEVNDPLVHYTPDDLKNPALFGNAYALSPPNAKVPSVVTNLTTLTSRYNPWGGNPKQQMSDATSYALEIKDPGVVSSDAWDFPANKLPNVGWLGRVHRGTPWQTVYLKANDIDAGTWNNWTGNSDNWPVLGGGTIADSFYSRPVTDRLLFDVFTTSPNPNAARGQLSVNQSGLAAWSAVLSGVLALSNSVDDATLVLAPPAFTPQVIEPAGVAGGNSPLQRIVDGINRTRTGNFGNTFTHLGDILAVPELTVGQPVFDFANGYWTNASPYLNLGDPATADSTHGNLTIQQWKGLNDAVYERLPQQILSLLRLGDQQRFVIYAYGQALKPADRSIVQSGPSPGLCTNYQITAETALRAVVRVEGASANDPKPFRPHVVVEQFNYLPPD